MLRIALVEDNADNRLLVRALVEDRYAVEEYETGSEALARMRESPPDMVLLDISLPGMDGYAVISALRSDGALKHLPVAALTAHAMLGDRERILAAGFDAYISKPIVDETALLRVIEVLIGPS
ncbi:MAG: response regulator [Planctomycetes bacterium]|nr:response regulator [Planctomycetota bacterium]